MTFNVAEKGFLYLIAGSILTITGFFLVRKQEMKILMKEINLKKEENEINNRKILDSEKIKKNIKIGKSTISRSMFVLKAILQAQNEDAAFSAFYNLLSKNLNASSYTVYMIDNDNNLKIKYSYSKNNSIKPGIMVKKGDNNILGYVAEKGEIVSTLGLERDKTLSGLFNKLPVKTLICAPIKIENKVVGLINIEEFSEGSYSREDLSVVDTSCFFLGLSLELLKVGYRF